MVSSVQMVALAGGENADVVAGPCVLTDLIVTETTGGTGGSVVVGGVTDGISYMALAVAAGQSVVWHGALALGSGINVASELGDVAVTIGWC